MTTLIVRGQTRHFARGDPAWSGYGADMPAQHRRTLARRLNGLA
jgi:hypothetical protein